MEIRTGKNGSKKESEKEYRKASVISIAGVDPSGCAGLLLDVRVISSLGFHPCGVVSAITFQNTCRGYGFEVASPEAVKEQLRSILEDQLVRGVKIGLLNSVKVAEVVVDSLEEHGLDEVVVWDPVYRSTTNLEFFREDFLEVADHLSSVVNVITPNADEAGILSGIEVINVDSAERAARMISKRFNSAVVVTGGKLSGTDVIFDGEKAFTVKAEFSPVEIRGTGCVYSSALTCYLVRGESIEDAVRLARIYLLESVKRARLTGKCSPCSEVANLE